MRWTASTSPSFLARHDAARSEEAAALLQKLELTRERLTAYFPRPLEGLTVVIHDSASSLWLARPQMALGWAATAPAARRYVAGCGGSKELHVLSSEVLARRASAVPGSREMLALAAPCGQTEHARPAIARRLREGARPSFPPSVRDAPLLGGTVIDLVAREQGQLAAARLACRLHPGGPRGALSRAFGGRSLVHSEGAWRSHLARLASGR